LKKNKILLSFALIEIAIFISILFIKINGFELYNIWFSVSLLLISLYELLYSYLFKLDSALYLGSLLTNFALATCLKYFYTYSLYAYYPVYILCFAMAHFTVFVFFRQIIHFKLFAFLLVEAILLIGYKANLINWWLLVGINGIYLCYLIINLLLRVAKNLRREQ